MLGRKIEKAQLPLTISEYNRRYLAESISSEHAERVRVHRVAVDLAHFRPKRSTESNEEAPLILAIGRLVPKKGFVHLIRACELLAQRGVNFRCWIIGEGPERAALQTAISASNLEERVCLVGTQTEIKKYLQRADVFVMPCVLDHSGDRDGIPTTLMEAMAMQVPVISTGISGIPELVKHEQTGLLTPPANAEALAQAICRLIADEQLRQKLAAGGRRHIETYHNLEANTRQLLQNILRKASREEEPQKPFSMNFLYQPVDAVRALTQRAKFFTDNVQILFA
jgi:glycosyltransferase involved in cell wall biosynthesis